MNKLFKMAGAMALTAVAVTISSCSDDDKDYLADIYFTGSAPAVRVVESAASGTPASGIAAFSLTFDAAGSWTIQAVDYFNQEQTADWVSFYAPAGGEGSQIVGVYTAANTSSQERAALVKATCNGTVTSFTLIQQAAAPVPNPNADAIAEKKQVTEIICMNGENLLWSYDFTYDKGALATMNVVTYNGEEPTRKTYTITSDARSTASGVAINKVNIKSSTATMNGQTFGVLNGKVLTGYDVISVQPDMTGRLISFDYNNAAQLTAVDGMEFNGKYTWNATDLTAMDFSGNGASGKVSASYSQQPNDASLDLVWFLGYGMNPKNQILGAMNLLGKRSANLPASVSGGDLSGQLTYTDGITDINNKTHAGLTVKCGSRTITVAYAE